MKLAARARGALPFVLAIALVAAILSRIDRRAYLASFANVAMLPMLASAALFVGALLVADGLATAAVYRRLGIPIARGTLLRLRGTSYIPSLLNHHVGQAFLTVGVARASGAPLARVTGGTLVVYASWLACLVGLAIVVVPMSPLPTAALALPLAGALAYGLALALRPPFLARRAPLAPLFEAGLRGHAHAIACRLPHMAIQLVGTWVPFALFGIAIPWHDAVVAIPLLMVVATLPITPQGVGTRDAVAAALFAKYAALPTIVAATTTWAVTLTLAEAAVAFALALSLSRPVRESPPRRGRRRRRSRGAPSSSRRGRARSPSS